MSNKYACVNCDYYRVTPLQATSARIANKSRRRCVRFPWYIATAQDNKRGPDPELYWCGEHVPVGSNDD